MWKMKATGVFIALLAAFGLSSCGGSSSGSNPGGEDQASVFTVGTDAPLPSVVSCQIMVTGVTINNGTTNVPVLTTPQVVDFAQLSGLHQLLDLNAVPTGTYSSATVTIASPVIGYIDTTQNPPAINTINGSLSQSSVTVNFANPFVLNAAELVGLRMEFDLRQSLQLNQSGQVTGVVDPVFHMQLLNATDANVSIDDFHAGVVGVTGDNTFTVQGPKGRQWTVQTNASTVLDDPSEPMSSFTTNTIVEVSGQLDPVSHDIDASEIEVVSDDKFVLGGLFTSIRPPSGPATQADLYVRYELPDITGVQDGQIETLALNGTERYKIANINNPITTLLFNNSALAAGQVVDVGGRSPRRTVSRLSPSIASCSGGRARPARGFPAAQSCSRATPEVSVERQLDGRHPASEPAHGAHHQQHHLHQPQRIVRSERLAGSPDPRGRIHPDGSGHKPARHGGSRGRGVDVVRLVAVDSVVRKRRCLVPQKKRDSGASFLIVRDNRKFL